MADSHDRVSLELIDVGDHKDRVVQVLSKVKGLNMPPEQIVNSAPCTIAANVPREVAEKLQGFLEKFGAMVMLEGEEDLFSPEDLPVTEEQQEAAEFSEELPVPDEEILSPEPPPVTEDEFQLEEPPASSEVDAFQLVEPSILSEEDGLTEARPPREESFGGFQAATLGSESEGEEEEFDEEEDLEEEEEEPGKFQKIFSRLSSLKGKKKTEDNEVEVKPEKEKKKFSLPSIPKFRKSKTEESIESHEEPEDIDTDEEGEPESKKIPELLLKYFVPGIVGFLVGALIMGAWGWSSIRSMQNEMDEKLSDYQQIKQSSAGVEAKIQQQEQQIAQLTQQNTELSGQVDTLNTQLEEARQAPKSILPSPGADIGALTPAQEAIVKAFQDLKEIHAKSLENGYTAQKNSGCSRQLLLDGKSTATYAQVVKKFTAKYTTSDIKKSDSLITPYIAEFKIPFQQEMRTGNSEKACDAVSVQQLPTPEHHEFGSFYGYWTIQYGYKDGKWRVKSTVIERNRALYESAFKLGSPDFAKFLVDMKLFPEFRN